MNLALWGVDMNIDDIEYLYGAPVRVLKENGITTVEQILEFEFGDLMKLNGMGQASHDKIYKAIFRLMKGEIMKELDKINYSHPPRNCYSREKSRMYDEICKIVEKNKAPN
jgi:hypothetical protein